MTLPSGPDPKSDRSADAEATLREVQRVAHGSADAVVGQPAHEARVDAPLQDEILEKEADVIGRERRDHCRSHTEASAQAAGDVVLAAALPHPERSRGSHAVLARIEPQHDLAEGDEVIAAVDGLTNRESGHGRASAASATA